MNTVRFVAVGRITRPHGVKGEVAVLPLSEVESRFEPGSRLLLGELGDRTLTVESSRPHRHRLLVSFREIRDRSQAESLQGEYLFVPASEAPALPEGAFWTHELVGCEVATETGTSLGRVDEVIRSVSPDGNDVWVARGGNGEVLIPALRDVIVSVDVRERRIVVRDVPGLTTSGGR